MLTQAQHLEEMYKTDVQLCYPFIEALMNTLRTQCSIHLTAGKPQFKSLQTEGTAEVFIIASIATHDMLASVSISFKKTVFLGLMGKMLGEKYTQITPDLEDGALELMNIVFNQAKRPLTEKRKAAVRSIPQVFFGENIRVRYLTRGRPIILPFETEVGQINIEISTQEVSVSDRI